MYYSNERVERLVVLLRRVLSTFYTKNSQTITMELNKGTLSLLSVPQEHNRFCSQRYTLVNFLPKTLIYSFMRLSNLFLLIVSLIMLIDEELSPFTKWIMIIQIFTGVFVYQLKEAIDDLQRRQKDKEVNTQKTKRGNKNGLIEEVLWRDVRMGDILFLSKGEHVPADLIVLDTGQVRDREALCMVDTCYFDGKSSLTKKRSSYLTQLIVLRTRQKSQFAEYRKLLTGRLEYEVPNSQTTRFKGRLKLKKDPKTEELTNDNFIPKGSRISQTSWLFGLVVYVGSKTKAAMSSKYYKGRCSSEEDQFNKVTLLMACLVVFYVLISIIILLARSDENYFAIRIDPHTQNGMKVFNLLILYSQLIPANFFLSLDLLALLRQITLSNLGHVDYLLLDKTGTLTTSYYKLDNFLFGSLTFNLNHDQLFTTLTKRDEDDFVKEQYLIPFEYDTAGRKTSQVVELLPFKKTLQTQNNVNVFNQILEPIESPPNSSRHLTYREFVSFRMSRRRNEMNNNDEFLQMVQQYKSRSPQSEYADNHNENALYYDCLMKCLILCHEARPVYGLDTTYESFSKNEEIALSFARLCGYSLESFNKFESPDVYHCKVRGEKISYNILGLNVYTYKRNVNSIVVQAPKSGDIGDWENSAITHLSGEGSKTRSLLICKGDYDAMKSKLKLSPKEQEELEQHVHVLKIRGVRMILYASRVLSEKETENYKKEFNLLKNSLTNQDEQLEQLAVQYEQDLLITGMMGFKEELKPDAIDFVQNLKNSNIHVWLLSGDQEAQTMSCAQVIIESHYNKYLRLVAVERDQIWLQLNAAIGMIQSEISCMNFSTITTILEGMNYQKMLKFVLVVNGESLSIICEDGDLLSHFRFLAGVCKHLVAYNMTPQLKELMCKTIRDYLNKEVMAVGDGFNDALMMQYANVSVEIINNKAYVNAGDIQVKQLTDITKLLTKSKSEAEKLHAILLYFYYSSGLIGMTMFFYNWFCYFTATSLHTSLMVLLYSFLFVTVNGLLLNFMHQKSTPFPALYIDGQITQQLFVKLFHINIIESFVTAAVVFYGVIYMFSYSTNTHGHTADLEMVCLGVMYVMLFNITLRITPNLNRIGILGQIILLACLIVIVAANYSEVNYEIFTRYHCVVSIIFSLFVSHFVKYCFQDVIRLRHFPTAYEQFAFKGREDDMFTYTNREILSQCIDEQVNISQIVQSVLTDCTMPSPYIQEMLNPADTKVTEMKLSPLTLEMHDLIVEKQFLSLHLQPSLNNLRLFTVLLLSYFVIYCLTDYFIGGQRPLTGIQYLSAFGICVIIVFYMMSTAMANNYYTSSHLLMFIIFVIKVILDWMFDDISLTLSALLVVLFTTTTHMKVVPIVIYNFLYLCQLVVRIVLVMKIHNHPNSSYSNSRIGVYGASTTIILMFSITLRCLFTFYKATKHKRTDFLARYAIEQDNLAANDILSILVPKFVRSQLHGFQEAQNDVSILFCYICDFDSIMKEEGRNVVLMLDSLFRIFDNICLQHGVQKIETVGYTYMAATGIKACEINISPHMLKTEKTMRLVNMAFDMMEQVQGRQYGKGNQIEMKIGIHVGRVIAGVIGHHKPQFSLIGDPVNQTSRVGSTGDAGAITLSEEAFKQAKQGVKYYSKKLREAKGLGLIDTYQVYKNKPPNYQVPVHQLKWQQLAKAALKQQRDVNPHPQQTFMQKIQSSLSNLADCGSQKLSGSPHVLGSPKTQFIQSLLQVPTINDQRRGSQLDTIPIQSLGVLESEESSQLIEESQHADLLAPNLLLMLPNSPKSENFYKVLSEQMEWESQVGFLALWVIYFVITLLSLVVRQFFGDTYLIFFIRSLFLISILILSPFIRQSYLRGYINWIQYLTFLYGAFTILYAAYLSDNSLVSTICLLELMYLTIVFCSLKMFSFVQVLAYMILVFSLFLTLYVDSGQIKHYYVYYLLCAMILCLIAYYKNIQALVSMFNNLQVNEEKKVKQISLVSQLLPTHAYLKMKNSSIYNRSEYIDEFEDVTLLFADIKGFTEYSHTQTPEGVVTMLRNLFTEFDKLCLQYNVYKMYTIGDCYVVMGFLIASKRNPIQEAINTVKMGFSMIDIIMEVRKIINFPKLNMRIGIHTGQVIGGIIGTDIVRYDIYGQDVSIANKMESSGTEGHVQISETTKQMIERADRNPFTFQFKQNVELAKFNTTINGYLVEWDKKVEHREPRESLFRRDTKQLINNNY